MIYTPAFWAMAVANLAHTASFSALFLLPLYIIDHGGDQRDVGLVMGIFALASAICRPWISEMIDRIGRKRSYTLGTSIMVVAPLLYLGLDDPMHNGYLFFLLLRLGHGVGMAICFTAVFTYMADIVPADRFNESIGMFGISGLIGVAVGPMLAEMFMDLAGYTGFFLTTMALALVSLLVHQPLKESFTNHQKQRGPSFFALLKQGKFMIVMLICLLFGLGLAATGGFVAPLAEQRILGVISYYYLSYSCGAITFRILGGRLADRLGENRILPYGLGLYILGLGLLPLTHEQWVLILAGFCAGGGHGLLFPALNSLAVRGEPAESRGKATGIFTGGIDTGAFAGSILLGYIGKWFGLNILFAAAAAGMAVGLMIFRFKRPKVST